MPACNLILDVPDDTLYEVLNLLRKSIPLKVGNEQYKNLVVLREYGHACFSPAVPETKVYYIINANGEWNKVDAAVAKRYLRKLYE